MKPADPDIKIKIPFQLHQSGRFDEASKIYQNLIAGDPGHHEAMNLLGLVALQSGQYAEAIKLIAAADLAPDNARYLSNLGEAYRKDGQYAAAIGRLEQALKVEPSLAGVAAKLGKALLENNEGVKAISAFRRAVKIDAENADIYNDLAAAYIRQGLATDAVSTWQKALEIDPGHALVRSNLGVALRDLGRLDEAIELYRTALEANPDLPEAHANLGIALREKGLIDQAIQSFDRAIALKPDNVNALYMHALVYDFKADDPNFARLSAALQSATLTTYHKILLNFALAKASDQTGRYDVAYQHLQRGNDGMATYAAYDIDAHRDEISSGISAFPTVRGATPEAQAIAAKPIFVTGISRSGKTLIESILSCNGDVFPALEHAGWTRAFNEKLYQNNLSKTFPACVSGLTSDDITDIGKSYWQEMKALSNAAR